MKFQMATMKDYEFGDVNGAFAPRHKAKRTSAVKGIAVAAVTVACTLLVLVSIGAIASHCGLSIYRQPVLVHAEHAIHEATHQLALREDCNETTSAAFESSADAVGAMAVDSTSASVSTSSTTKPVGTSFPISTETQTSTIYSIRTEQDVTTVVKTTTATTSIAVTRSASIYSEEACTGFNSTTTVFVTIYPAESCAATVTGNPLTVTDVNTDTSYTSGFPDATISGNPSTVTDVHTDVSLTSGLPDVTVPGSPSTVTNVESSFFGSSLLTTATKTTVMTVGSSLITLTISDLYPSVSGASSAKDGAAASATTPSPIYTSYVTTTAGPPAISTATVHVPYPGTNSSSSVSPSGIISGTMMPTSPVIVSGGGIVNSGNVGGMIAVLAALMLWI